MRDIEAIKADIAYCVRNSQHDKAVKLFDELRAALTDDIPLDRLEAICAAEKDGRLVVLPCKPNDAYWHRNYDTGELELNLEMHELREHDDTYPEIDSCAYWE